MNKDVLINITGTQTMESGPKEVIELFTVGKLKKTGDGFEISYLEGDSDFPPGVMTTLSIEPKAVTICRDNHHLNRMTVEQGQRHLCHYETGFGGMMIGVFGEQIASSIQEDGGELSLRYTIDINANFTSLNELHISVREA